MSIMMIHGPEEPDPGQATVSIPDSVQASLSLRAASAGKVLMRYRCGTEDELIQRLQNAAIDRAEIILLDPGRCAQASEGLRDAPAKLQVPYIEVHDDHSDAPEPVITPRTGPLVTIVNGSAAQSYTLAMSLALEKIGCSECENDIHVGT